MGQTNWKTKNDVKNEMLNHLVSLVICFVRFFNFIICILFNCDLSNSHIEGNYFRQNKFTFGEMGIYLWTSHLGIKIFG